MLKSIQSKKMLGLGLAASMLLGSLPAAFAQSDPYQNNNPYQTNTTVNTQASQPQTHTRSSWSEKSPAAKVMTGTAVGAAAGGVTGLFTGLTMHATSRGAMKMKRGTAVARGLGWGSVYGAGIGFLAGLGSAIFSSKPVAVSTVGHTASR